LLLSAASAACGDDDTVLPPLSPDSGSPVDGDAQVDAGRDAAAPPATDSGTGMTPQTVTCGGQTCSAPQLDIGALLGGGGGALPIPPGLLDGFTAGLLQGCCTEADMACGVQSDTFLGGVGCLEREQPGTPSEACPDIDITINVMVLSLPLTLQGCCRSEDNLCGLDLGLLGVGCLELTVADQIQIMGTVEDAGLTGSVACVPGQDGDAGAEDAGQ
jgi:hypothetical protein